MKKIMNISGALIAFICVPLVIIIVQNKSFDPLPDLLVIGTQLDIISGLLIVLIFIKVLELLGRIE